MRLLKLSGLVLVLIILCGCSSPPDAAVSGLFAALNEGNSKKAMDYLCADRPIILPSQLPQNFISNANFQVISNDGINARVKVRADIRIDSQLFQIKKAFDFTALVRKDRDKWCVAEESFEEELRKILEIK
jgi:hypothetical protein